jgi:hypothetical protein
MLNNNNGFFVPAAPRSNSWLHGISLQLSKKTFVLFKQSLYHLHSVFLQDKRIAFAKPSIKDRSHNKTTAICFDKLQLLEI